MFDFQPVTLLTLLHVNSSKKLNKICSEKLAKSIKLNKIHYP